MRSRQNRTSKPKNPNGPLDPDRRKDVYERDCYCCRICTSTERIEAHHVKPKKFGRVDSMTNLITLCHKCHTSIDLDSYQPRAIENCMSRVREHWPFASEEQLQQQRQLAELLYKHTNLNLPKVKRIVDPKLGAEEIKSIFKRLGETMQSEVKDDNGGHDQL